MGAFFTVGHDLVTMTQDVITTAMDFATAIGGAANPGQSPAG